ncbi:MAG TPA: hypothetical protein VLB27_01755, partial [candidate division Zixibacteria bacterium]|nr:hypothetical protein [candidate division Zixibacteria bacterium]
LHAERALVQSEFVDKIRKMTDPDPKSVEGTSMLNRPNAKLDEIGEWQDYHRGIITETRAEIAGLIAEREQLERRAAGTGGPPPVIPEPQPTPQPTPTEQPATGTATGSEGGDTDSATAGGRPVHPGGWVRRDTDTSGGTTGGSGGAGDGGSGGSIGDMLREFGGDEEGGGSGGGTVTVGEELLVDIQGQFDNAFAELEQCRHEFDGRMNALMGLEPAEICADPVLASAYSCIQSNFDRCSDLYGEAHSQLTAASRGRRWDKMGMESDVMSEDESGINPMDQITIILINTKYQSASGALGQSRERLFANAPGCDPEDLTGGSGTTAGGDDGSGTGGGGTGGGGTGNGGGSTGGTGGTDGGGTGEEGYYFAKLAGPQYHSGGTEAHCGGGSLKITQSGEPDFPDEIHPGDNITVRLPVSWTASSGVEEVKVVISIFFMDPANIQQKEYRALRGNSQGVYQFSANNVDFSREGGVITIVYGGSVDCEEESAETGGTIYTQAYQRVGH